MRRCVLTDRQKQGVGLGISGVITLALGIVTAATKVDPPWVQLVLNVLSFAFPALGLVINFPSNTGAQK